MPTLADFERDYWAPDREQVLAQMRGVSGAALPSGSGWYTPGGQIGSGEMPLAREPIGVIGGSLEGGLGPMTDRAIDPRVQMSEAQKIQAAQGPLWEEQGKLPASQPVGAWGAALSGGVPRMGLPGAPAGAMGAPSRKGGRSLADVYQWGSQLGKTPFSKY